MTNTAPQAPPKIYFIKNCFIAAKNLKDAKIFEIVQMGYGKLIGEIIGHNQDETYIQSYEHTARLAVNDQIYPTNHYFLAKLEPGIFNHGQKNQDICAEKKWNFLPKMFKGSKITPGDILGEVKETPCVSRQIMAPYNARGELFEIKSGNFMSNEPVARIQNGDKLIDITMRQSWPLRMPRDCQERISFEPELISKCNILDSIFCAKINHEDEMEKNIMQRQLAKWAEADLIIAVLPKERLPEFKNKFTEFKDLKSKRSLMEKTIFFVNETEFASSRDIFMDKAVTNAEYFRDMGYNVILIIDSLNEWKRDLDDMARSCQNKTSYYSLRLKNFFARAGRVKCLGKDGRTGSLVIIGGE